MSSSCNKDKRKRHMRRDSLFFINNSACCHLTSWGGSCETHTFCYTFRYVKNMPSSAADRLSVHRTPDYGVKTDKEQQMKRGRGEPAAKRKQHHRTFVCSVCIPVYVDTCSLRVQVPTLCLNDDKAEQWVWSTNQWGLRELEIKLYIAHTHTQSKNIAKITWIYSRLLNI